MSAKHFINDSTHLVTTSLHSLTLTNPSVAADLENKIIYRKVVTSSSEPQVSIISGGGSGHEPSFAAFVGPGLLSAAVAGTIFASPSAEQVRRCILGRVDKRKGVLVVVMNYTGDVLHFGMASSKAQASGWDVDMVVVGDDAGVGRAQGGKVGRRGIAGTCLVQKIAGALAANDASLKEVHRVAQLVADNVVSIGASLLHVHVPGRSVDSGETDLQIGEVEVGMGIHNEAGSERIKTDLPGLIKTMLAHQLDQNDTDRAFFKLDKSDETVLLVNNLGGVSSLEMGGITDEVVRQLDQTWGVKPVRILSGTYMTSLNGLGFSISILKLTDTGLGSGRSMLELLDAPAEAAGWSAAVSAETWQAKQSAKSESLQEGTQEAKPSNLELDPQLAYKAVTSGLNRLIAAEPDITNYDTIVGDGDCGIGLKRGAEALLKLLEQPSNRSPDAAIFMDGVVHVVESSMDGTSGALYAIFLNAVAHGLRQQSIASPQEATPQVWAKALQSSLQALGKYTPAQPGDRTVIDALSPFVGELAQAGDVHKAAEAALAGAKGTKGMKARLGRTVYVGGESWQEVPDPGAIGLSEFLLGLSDGLR